MTFEEIREMVNSTITENGQRQITGKALNLALVETLAAIEEVLANDKGGAASEIAYFPNINTGEMDPEHQAHNLEIYNKFKAAFEAGEPLPLLSIDAAFMFAEVEEQLGQPANASGYYPCSMVLFIPADSPLATEMGNAIMFEITIQGGRLAGLIQPDGNAMIMS